MNPPTHTTKVAVVTGGSKGIGKALVKKLAGEGLSVYFCSRGIAAGRELVDEVAAKFPQAPRPVFIPADLSEVQAVKAFCKQIRALTGKIDLLVNNTGYFTPGQIHTEPDGTLESMINTNLYSAYYTTRELLPIIAHEGGHIVNMCSTASFMPYTNGGSYCISKFALLGMSKVLREEMKPYGIRVTSVMPGATLTASWAGTELPEDRFMPADDVAEMVYAAFNTNARTTVEEIVMRPLLGDL